MKKLMFTLLMVCAALLGAIPAARAQQNPPPTIFLFASDVASVTVDELETGELLATLSWHVAHVTDEHQIMLYVYKGYGWTFADDDLLPPVGSLEVPLEPPLNFAPPTFKLVVVNQQGATLDERTLVIPYDIPADPPTIASFASDVRSLEAAALAPGAARVAVSWEVTNRWPQSQIVFEQVLSEDEARNVELPRDILWVPSHGSGAVAPVQPPNSSVIRLRLRVIDVISADAYDEAEITISVTGTALPPEGSTPQPTTPPAAPAATFGDLAVLTDCQANANTDPQRGWVDGEGVFSPDSARIAYATNPVGDAKLILANADGSGQIEVDAPNKGIPISTRPVWSPDGAHIAFANIAISQPGGGFIYVVNADGTELRGIASYVGYYDALAWSPDSARLYFTSGVASGTGSGMSVGEYKVYIVTADGFGTPEVVMEGCAEAP
jgi:hypothetical protein